MQWPISYLIFAKMRKSVIALMCTFGLASAQAQVESALNLMADSLRWLNHCTTLMVEPEDEDEDSLIQIVGLNPAQLISEIDLNLFDHIYTYEPAPEIPLNLINFEDSADVIPGFIIDGKWDTKRIHEVEALEWDVDSLLFLLTFDTCDFSFPTQYPRITSPFGPRWGRNHNGLDLGLRTGEPVKAAFEGMVRISHYSQSYGNVVVIRHKNGLETLYAHLEARFVQPGQWIQNGQIIGLGGNTGRSYGAHLHFEIRYLGNAIDPSLVLDVPSARLKKSSFYLTKENSKKPVYSSKKKNKRDKKGSKGGKYHSVKRGETLSTISRKTGTSVSQLCKLNRLRPSSVLRVGQRVRYK